MADYQQVTIYVHFFLTYSYYYFYCRLELSIVAAPALVYKKDTVVCGHSMEINFITDIEFNLSLGQIKLASAILTEFLNMFQPFYEHISVQRKVVIASPYTKMELNVYDSFIQDDIDISSIELGVDSGFETSDFISTSIRTKVLKNNIILVEGRLLLF